MKRCRGVTALAAVVVVLVSLFVEHEWGAIALELKDCVPAIDFFQAWEIHRRTNDYLYTCASTGDSEACCYGLTFKLRVKLDCLCSVANQVIDDRNVFQSLADAQQKNRSYTVINIPENVLSSVDRRCQLKIPQTGICRGYCGWEQSTMAEIEQTCSRFRSDCCDRLRPVDFNCLCSPGARVVIPPTLLTAARFCRIPVPNVGQCRQEVPHQCSWVTSNELQETAVMCKVNANFRWAIPPRIDRTLNDPNCCPRLTTMTSNSPCWCSRDPNPIIPPQTSAGAALCNNVALPKLLQCQEAQAQQQCRVVTVGEFQQIARTCILTQDRYCCPAVRMIANATCWCSRSPNIVNIPQDVRRAAGACGVTLPKLVQCQAEATPPVPIQPPSPVAVPPARPPAALPPVPIQPPSPVAVPPVQPPAAVPPAPVQPPTEASSPVVAPPIQPPAEAPSPDVAPPILPPIEAPSPVVAPPVQPPAEAPSPNVAPPILPPIEAPSPVVALPVQPPAEAPSPVLAPPTQPPAEAPSPTVAPPVQPPAETPSPVVAPPVLPPIEAPSPVVALPVQPPTEAPSPVLTPPTQPPVSAPPPVPAQPPPSVPPPVPPVPALPPPSTPPVAPPPPVGPQNCSSPTRLTTEGLQPLVALCRPGSSFASDRCCGGLRLWNNLTCVCSPDDERLTPTTVFRAAARCNINNVPRIIPQCPAN